jgi:REP element-mobilizing transposase RayT
MKRRRYLIDDSKYPIFVTTTIVHWIPIFAVRELAEYSLIKLENVRQELNAIIYGFVLLPGHLHIIIQSQVKGNLSVFMKRWKGNTAKYILAYCMKNNHEWLKRFAENARRYKISHKQTYQIWQPRFDEKAIRDEKEFIAKLNYMHGNPLKHNLVDDCADYPYSSFADYNGGKNGFVLVECGHNKL